MKTEFSQAEPTSSYERKCQALCEWLCLIVMEMVPVLREMALTCTNTM